jgi:hypothetical protein
MAQRNGQACPTNKEITHPLYKLRRAQNVTMSKSGSVTHVYVFCSSVSKKADGFNVLTAASMKMTAFWDLFIVVWFTAD